MAQFVAWKKAVLVARDKPLKGTLNSEVLNGAKNKEQRLDGQILPGYRLSETLFSPICSSGKYSQMRSPIL
ncbi:hypothetical protein ABIB40_001380 [Pedobacter sp. UYP30]